MARKLNALKRQNCFRTITPFPTPKESIYNLPFDPIADINGLSDYSSLDTLVELKEKTKADNDLSQNHPYFEYPNEDQSLINTVSFGHPYENIRESTFRLKDHEDEIEIEMEQKVYEEYSIINSLDKLTLNDACLLEKQKLRSTKIYKPKRFLQKICNLGDDIQNYDKLVQISRPNLKKENKKSGWYSSLFGKKSKDTDQNLQSEVSRLITPLNPEDFEDEFEYRQKLSKQNAFINCFL